MSRELKEIVSKLRFREMLTSSELDSAVIGIDNEHICARKIGWILSAIGELQLQLDYGKAFFVDTPLNEKLDSVKKHLLVLFKNEMAFIRS